MHTDENMANELSETLRRNGLRATAPRLAVMAALRSNGKPLSVQGIIKRIERRSIDQATVYRTLNTLQAAGVVKSIDFQHGHSHFELTDGKHHHHIVCTQCRKIEDIEDCDIQALQAKALREKGFASIEKHSLEFFGVCNSCTMKA